jgi:hypothetical protein
MRLSTLIDVPDSEIFLHHHENIVSLKGLTYEIVATMLQYLYPIFFKNAGSQGNDDVSSSMANPPVGSSKYSRCKPYGYFSCSSVRMIDSLACADVM